MTDLPGELSEEQAGLVFELMEAKGYAELKPTQREAFHARILEGGNHLLVAPTSNGKTFCAETVTKQTLDAGGRVAYLVPSTQLVGAKTDELNEWAGEDIYVAPAWHDGAYQRGDVIIATFDSFFQAMLRDIGGVSGLDRVVLDDFHVIYGSYRGTDLEKAIAAILDEDISVFAMSATLGNPEELAAWMNTQPIISDQDRGNPIHEHPIEKDESTALKDQLRALLRENSNHAPFLVFNNSRSKAEARAKTVAEAGVFNDYPEDNESYKAAIRRACGDDVAFTSRLERLGGLMDEGVAYHHAGLPREIRLWIEECYQNGKLGALFCTPTLAYGFDAPVRSVVVAGVKRYTGGGMSYIDTWEYVQWIGRAARPDMGYEEGHAYTFYQNFDEAADRYFGEKELERVTSHVSEGPTLQWLLLELVEMGWTTAEEIEEFLQQTLYWEQISDGRAWETGSSDRLDRLRKTLRAEMDWLVEHGFARERQTTHEFETTEFGSAAVEFNFSLRDACPPSKVYDLAKRLEQADEFTPFGILRQFAAFVSAYMRPTDSGISIELQATIMDRDGDPESDPDVAATVMAAYWVQGVDVSAIEEQAGVDPTGIRNTARTIATAIKASSALFSAIEADEPSWLSDLAACVEQGVPRYLLPLVEQVEGIGRTKARDLSAAMEGVAGFPSAPDELPARLAIFREQTDGTQFKDTVRIPDGIGPKLSERLNEFAEYYPPPETPPEPLFESNADLAESNTSPSFARDSTLDEFT